MISNIPSSALTFNDYEVWSRTTAIYPGALTGGPDELAYLALGLAGEAGEVANKIKKHLRGEDLNTTLSGRNWVTCSGISPVSPVP